MRAATFGEAFRAAVDTQGQQVAGPHRLYHCLRKAQYTRLIDAQEALITALDSSKDGSHHGMRVYRCKYGQHYHVGHPRER
jgi:hypothetical protein